MSLQEVILRYPVNSVIVEYLTSEDWLSLVLIGNVSIARILSNLQKGWKIYGIACVSKGRHLMPSFQLVSQPVLPPSILPDHALELQQLIENLCPRRKYYVEFVNAGVGWGLMTSQYIAPDTCLLPYLGDYINTAECKRRHDSMSNAANYILSWNEHFALNGENVVFKSHIDARRSGGISRFINHSCDPNLRVSIQRVPSCLLGVPVFLSCRSIFPGEQLTFHYGASYGPKDAVSASEQISSSTADTIDQEIKRRKVMSAVGAVPRKVCYCGSLACDGLMPLTED